MSSIGGSAVPGKSAHLLLGPASRRKTIRLGGSGSKQDHSDGLEEKIPTGDELIRDLVLKTQLNGTWHSRRVVYNKDVIAFALETKDTLIDAIPLEGVESIQSLNAAAGDGNPVVGDNADDLKCCFQIKTTLDGHNAGRTYILKANSPEQCKQIADNLAILAGDARNRKYTKSRFQRSQERVRRILESAVVEKLSAVIILATFALSIVEAQLIGSLHQGRDSKQAATRFFESANVAVTIFFAAELLVNAYANWLDPLIRNPWTWLDILVVVISLLAFGPLKIPITAIRIMRAIRIVRVFGRLKQLKKLIRALSAALLPMLNAFTMLLIIASIYAIMGVSFFGSVAPEDFGVYDRAFLALFRVTAGETWIASLDILDPDGSVNWDAALFIITYIMLVNWVVLQVSVAVLLDNFVTSSHQIDAEEEMERKAARQVHDSRNPLEPLILKLTRSFTDGSDLSSRLLAVFKALDSDGAGSLSSQKFCTAIKNLTFNPRIYISDSDFVSITQGGALCNAQGRLGPDEFERVMREQIRIYIQSNVSELLDEYNPAAAEFAQLGALKLLLMEQQDIKKLIKGMSQRDTQPPSESSPSCPQQAKDFINESMPKALQDQLDREQNASLPSSFETIAAPKSTRPARFESYDFPRSRSDSSESRQSTTVSNGDTQATSSNLNPSCVLHQKPVNGGRFRGQGYASGCDNPHTSPLAVARDTPVKASSCTEDAAVVQPDGPDSDLCATKRLGPNLQAIRDAGGRREAGGEAISGGHRRMESTLHLSLHGRPLGQREEHGRAKWAAGIDSVAVKRVGTSESKPAARNTTVVLQLAEALKSQLEASFGEDLMQGVASERHDPHRPESGRDEPARFHGHVPGTRRTNREACADYATRSVRGRNTEVEALDPNFSVSQPHTDCRHDCRHSTITSPQQQHHDSQRGSGQAGAGLDVIRVRRRNGSTTVECDHVRSGAAAAAIASSHGAGNQWGLGSTSHEMGLALMRMAETAVPPRRMAPPPPLPPRPLARTDRAPRQPRSDGASDKDDETPSELSGFTVLRFSSLPMRPCRDL